MVTGNWQIWLTFTHLISLSPIVSVTYYRITKNSTFSGLKQALIYHLSHFCGVPGVHLLFLPGLNQVAAFSWELSGAQVTKMASSLSFLARKSNFS